MYSNVYYPSSSSGNYITSTITSGTSLAYPAYSQHQQQQMYAQYGLQQAQPPSDIKRPDICDWLRSRVKEVMWYPEHA